MLFNEGKNIGEAETKTTARDSDGWNSALMRELLYRTRLHGEHSSSLMDPQELRIRPVAVDTLRDIAVHVGKLADTEETNKAEMYFGDVRREKTEG